MNNNDLSGLCQSILDGDLEAVPALFDCLKEQEDARLGTFQQLFGQLIASAEDIETRITRVSNRRRPPSEDQIRRIRYHPWESFASNFSVLFAYELLPTSKIGSLARLSEMVGSKEHAEVWKTGGIPYENLKEAPDDWDEDAGGEMMTPRDMQGRFSSHREAMTGPTGEVEYYRMEEEQGEPSE